ncbi:unnamed protein product [Fraxinus pennsylvanica]|uniref:Integrase catalytic domain-containing protein n=1 Tax=Fraxinus pennsylvanica TaxID=56036 RepID=A0AAD2EAG0_9LAMI|nr:unnamed protein product [Fraxinus pennsylvanica]
MMEVYIDDMLVKCLRSTDHIEHLRATFKVLREYRMKLNPLKCAFGIASGKFLGYMNVKRHSKGGRALGPSPLPSKPKEGETLLLYLAVNADDIHRRNGIGASVLLESPKGYKLNCAVRFGFKTSNNAAEYEVFLVGLRLAKEMQMKKLAVRSDSQLVVSQVSGSFATKDKSMAMYLKKVRQVSALLLHSKITIPRVDHSIQSLVICQMGGRPNTAYAKRKRLASYVIVAIDYFTKWIEAEPLAKITEANTSKFIWKNILCRFGISHSIVTNNGRQFDNQKLKDLCVELGIKNNFLFSSPPPGKWPGRGSQQNYKVPLEEET